MMPGDTNCNRLVYTELNFAYFRFTTQNKLKMLVLNCRYMNISYPAQGTVSLRQVDGYCFIFSINLIKTSLRLLLYFWLLLLWRHERSTWDILAVSLCKSSPLVPDCTRQFRHCKLRRQDSLGRKRHAIHSKICFLYLVSPFQKQQCDSSCPREIHLMPSSVFAFSVLEFWVKVEWGKLSSFTGLQME